MTGIELFKAIVKAVFGGSLPAGFELKPTAGKSGFTGRGPVKIGPFDLYLQVNVTGNEKRLGPQLWGQLTSAVSAYADEQAAESARLSELANVLADNDKRAAFERWLAAEQSARNAENATRNSEPANGRARSAQPAK